MSRGLIDLPGPELELSPALVGVDGGLRLGLAAAFGVAAAWGPHGLWTPTGLAFGVTALLHLSDRSPRVAGVAGMVLALLAVLGSTQPAPWLGVLGAAGVRARLQWSPTGDHLARLRSLRRTQARGLAAMELRRVRAAGLAEDPRDAELKRAGDAFERAGRARAELRALGVEGGGSSLPRYAAPLAGALPSRVVDATLRWLEKSR